MPFGKRQPKGYRGVERRREVRTKSNLDAYIVLPTGQLIKCRVSNFAKTGARLVLPSAFALPDTFELRGLGSRNRARLVHRGVGYAGVEFV